MFLTQAWNQLTSTEEYRIHVGTSVLTHFWYDNKVRVNNKSIYYKEWNEKRVAILNDLLDGSKNFYIFRGFTKKYVFNCDFVRYPGVFSAVTNASTQIELQQPSISHPYIPQTLYIFL